MLSRKLVLVSMCVLGCAMFSIFIGWTIQTSAQTTRINIKVDRPLTVKRGISLTNIRRVQTEFNENFAELMKHTAASETTIVNTKVWKDIVDKTIYKTTNTKIVMASIPEEDLRGLRDLINARIESQVLPNQRSRSIGEGRISNSFFTGDLLP